MGSSNNIIILYVIIIMEEVTSIIKDSRLEKYEKLAKILKYLFVDLAKISQDSYYILGSFSIRAVYNRHMFFLRF